jgi:hypothetical protein
MSASSRATEIWGAQLHVRPMPGTDGGLSGSAGAFAWVFALATNEAEYREMASAKMAGLGLFIAQVEHLDRYDPHELDDDETRGCFERLSDEWPVQYHSFHTYPSDEA